MNIEFAGRKIDVRQRIVDPGKIRPNDFIQVESVLVKCITRQGGCPIWESNRLVVVYLFESETGARFSMRDLKGKFTVLRTKKGKK